MNEEMIDPEKLKALQAEVANLPRAVQPPDVWDDIHAAIQRESVTPISNGGTPGIRFWQKPGFLLAATVALIASTTATTVIALRGGRTAPPARAPAVAVAPGSAAASLVQFTAKENNYIETAKRLQAVVESDRSTLSPETIAKLKKSIAIIDAAILEAREALAADPANKDLIDMLSSSYDKKVDLLRRSAAMGRT